MIAMIAPPRYLPVVFALGTIAIASAACSKNQPTKDELLSRANDFLAAGQYDKAEAEYRNVLRTAPADPVANGRLGILYYDQGELVQAFPLLTKAAELRPEDPQVQLKMGQAYLSVQDFPHAREAALRVLGTRQGDENALLLLADAAVAPNDIEETRKVLESLREKDTDRPGYHLALGQLALRQNDPARAESEFKAAQQLDPNSSAVHFSWANLYLIRKDLKAADQALKAAADLSPLRSFRRMRYADFKLQTGAVAEAKTILEEVTGKAPDYLPARVRLMKIACGEHRDDDCAARVKNVLAQDPVNYDAVLIDGNLNLAKGETKNAIREFEFLSNVYPRSAQVRYALAAANLLNTQDTNAVDNAINSLNVALSLDPQFDQATLLLAELRIRKGQYTTAVDALTQLIKERPQVAQAHLLLARAYLAQRNGGQALAVYRHMAELFPKDPQPPYLIGTILAQGKQPDARKEFEKSLEISPDYLPAMEELVNLDIAEKQYATALDRVQKQIDKNPKLAPAWGVRAKIYLAQQDLTHAEADLLKAIELDPKLERGYVLLAQLYVASNRQEQAIGKLNAFVAKNDKDVITLMQLAMINDQLQHFDAARDAYEKLLAVDPKFAPALNNLAIIYSEHLGRPDTAYDLARRAREAAPQEPHLADTLGWVLFKKGEYDNALQLLQESAGKVPENPEVQFHLGMAHYMLGDEGPARIALQKAADAPTDFPGKDEARQRLALLAIDARTASPAARTELENYLRERPNDPEALVRLARLQERDGTVDQAVKTYEKIVDAYPQFASATRQLALLYGQRSVDDKKAYDVVLKARQAYPDDPELAKAAGILGYRRGNYSQAAEQLQQVIAKRKDDPELLYYIGMAHYQLKQYPEAQGELQRVLGMNLPATFAEEARRALDDPEFAKALGVLDYRRGNYSQAAEQLQQVAAKRKDDPELLYYLGMAHYQLKKYAETKGELQRALDMNLPPELAENARRALSDCCKELK
jgi:tetratricopeptide (TPR) repeat protein